MNWHEFIFSEKRSVRISRHLMFWLIWWAYFASTYYYYVQVGLQKISFGELSEILFFKTFLLVLIHLMSCYFFIYVLLPNYLLKGRYLGLSAGIILLVAGLVAVGYFIHATIFPVIDNVFQYKPSAKSNILWWTSISSVLLNAPKVIAAATVIKLVKRWYLKQKEKERVEKEKLVTDLQLLKAQIRPDFLFHSLNQIYLHTVKKSPDAEGLLIKLSDLLSYLLYECDELKVSLDKELNMMKGYMELEKSKFSNRLEMEIGIRGNTENRMIAPLLLLPFIENSFRQCANLEENPWINLEISADNNILTMKLMNGVTPADAESDTVPIEVTNAKKRLDLFYSQNYELKMYAEQEIYMVRLKVNLSEKTTIEFSEPVIATNNNHHPFTNPYALQ